jgi:broad specificity phosphatase PhoE
MTTRLHLLCSASTAAVSAIAFAAADEPLDRRGLESLSEFSGRLPSCDVILRSPAHAAAETVKGLALDAQIEPMLRDCDYGRWTGRSLVEVQAEAPEALAGWLHDPHAAPHGGESFADVLVRVARWMDGLLAQSGSILAITHASVIRAAIAHALGAGPAAQGHIGVAPLTHARLSGHGGRWTLAALVSLKDER